MGKENSTRKYVTTQQFVVYCVFLHVLKGIYVHVNHEIKLNI